MVAAIAPRPVLKRFWTTASRDHNGRLPEDLCIRIEWTEGGITRAAVGGFTGESISWLYGSLVPGSVEDVAIDAALDAGESAEVYGATFEGTQPLAEMYRAVESVCLGCGARVESIDHLDCEGRCSQCFVRGTAPTDAQIEALLGEAIANENVELVDLCETALKPIVQESLRRQAVARIAEILARKEAA